VWAVGAHQVAHWTGSTWVGTTVSGGVLHSIWAHTPSDVFVGGSNNTILRWNGTTWSSTYSSVGLPATFRAMWGAGPGIFSAEAQGHVYHWAGNTWHLLSGGSPYPDGFEGLGGTSSTDLWASTINGELYHCDLSSCTYAATSNGPVPLQGIAGSGPGDVW